MSDTIKNVVEEYLRSTTGLEKSDTGFEVRESAVINVLVVGRSQTGKTTLIESLKNSAYASYLTGFSATRNVTHHPIVIRHKETNQYYQINLIDTIGLGEHAQDPANNRTDQEILSLAAKFISQSITTLNAIIFVSKAGEIHLHDLQVFKTLKDFIGDSFRANSMMVLTHCDGYTMERFNQLAESIRTNSLSQEIAEYCTLGIHPHGTINFEQLEQYRDERYRNLRQGLIEQKLDLITPMRKKILQLLIAQHGKQQPIQQLQEIMKIVAAEQNRLIEEEIKKRAKKGCIIM